MVHGVKAFFTGFIADAANTMLAPIAPSRDITWLRLSFIANPLLV
jgi:hypothetical protein